MFIPCDAMLYFYLLLGQSYYDHHSTGSSNVGTWYQHKELITNENIYNINETLESVMIKSDQ